MERESGREQHFKMEKRSMGTRYFPKTHSLTDTSQGPYKYVVSMVTIAKEEIYIRRYL